MRFGKWVLLENVYEMLDASLEPILMQQVFKQGGQDVIKIGDNIIPYSDTFRFFMTTKMANPHYPPEVQVKVSIINFTVTQSGLEDQLLNICVQVRFDSSRIVINLFYWTNSQLEAYHPCSFFCLDVILWS